MLALVVPVANAQILPPTQYPTATAAPSATDSVAQRKRRLRLLVGSSALGYSMIYTDLTTAWYTGERVSLHWFNDLPE